MSAWQEEEEGNFRRTFGDFTKEFQLILVLKTYVAGYPIEYVVNAKNIEVQRGGVGVKIHTGKYTGFGIQISKKDKADPCSIISYSCSNIEETKKGL